MSKALSLDEDVDLARHADAIRTLSKRAISSIIEIGHHLTAAKATVGHGKWLRWLEAEFGWTDDTALNYMRLWEWPNPEQFGILTYLSAPSTF
jgi:Protein of unknown function (DUF3102)